MRHYNIISLLDKIWYSSRESFFKIGCLWEHSFRDHDKGWLFSEILHHINWWRYSFHRTLVWVSKVILLEHAYNILSSGSFENIILYANGWILLLTPQPTILLNDAVLNVVFVVSIFAGVVLCWTMGGFIFVGIDDKITLNGIDNFLV